MATYQLEPFRSGVRAPPDSFDLANGHKGTKQAAVLACRSRSAAIFTCRHSSLPTLLLLAGLPNLSPSCYQSDDPRVLACRLSQSCALSQALTSIRSSRSALCFSMDANKMQMAIPSDASQTSSKGGNVGARRKVRSYGSRQ